LFFHLPERISPKISPSSLAVFWTFQPVHVSGSHSFHSLGPCPAPRMRETSLFDHARQQRDDMIPIVDQFHHPFSPVVSVCVRTHFIHAQLRIYDPSSPFSFITGDFTLRLPRSLPSSVRFHPESWTSRHPNFLWLWYPESIWLLY